MAAEPPEPASSQDAQLAASSSAAVDGVGDPNPCCAKLWKKYQKLETSRTALREAVKLLQAENEKLQKENSELSKGSDSAVYYEDMYINFNIAKEIVFQIAGMQPANVRVRPKDMC
ncbi:uncharacterized protein LOC110430299 isoform X3 [Sorghum bicolor]|uniref:uncharacterized protein LOC110430299 isoform X3 n=1 Tax=Sorghum bicolor TaxID=4558 RepID=UPI000B425EFE|nr:uncharacterized protein LOC110430299 isoform X3 [Sorghum bicolor]|eukprot:XP_021303437.1 uncharacterized protein LOC110430299 isoform X3 [Sorghum bicolor]